MMIKEFNQINCCMDILEETCHGEQCMKACFVGYNLQGCISNDLTNILTHLITKTYYSLTHQI